MTVEVKMIDNKNYGLYIDGVLLGTSKLHCDAMLAKHTLDAALSASTAGGEPVDDINWWVVCPRCRFSARLDEYVYGETLSQPPATPGAGTAYPGPGAPCPDKTPSREEYERTPSEPPALTEEPWLYAIEETSEDGRKSWHDGEQCVFSDRESAQDEIDSLNDGVKDWQGSPYAVVPLYRAALAASTKAGKP